MSGEDTDEEDSDNQKEVKTNHDTMWQQNLR